MGVHDAAEIGPCAVNLLVERQLRRRPMRTIERAIRMHAHDVFAAQGSLINARGGNPEIAVFLEDGEVAAAGGGHAVAVDPLNGGEDLIARMDVGDSGRHLLYCGAVNSPPPHSDANRST